MNWNILQEESQLESITQESFVKPILIFKHSTTCSISHAAFSRLERSWNDTEHSTIIKPYYLDLLKLRPISNKIAETFRVIHESPQAIIIKDGKAIYNASHFDIRLNSILSEAISNSQA